MRSVCCFFNIDGPGWMAGKRDLGSGTGLWYDAS